MSTQFTASGDWDAEFDAAVMAQVVVPLAQAIKADARRMAPVDTGELSESIDIEYMPGGARIGSQVPHALVTELGGGPHEIESTGAWPLRNKRTGQVYGRRVMHPGVPEQPYLRPALYRNRSL